MKRLAVLLLLAACRKSDPPPKPPAPHAPRTQAELPTTDGKIALENLDAQIASARPADRAALLLQRASLLGRMADYDRAAALELPPPARAEVDAALHRFAKASSVESESLRATILQATGRLDEALAIREKLARPRIGELTALAVALADVGRLEEAERKFLEAQEHVPDLSPFPVATLWFQYGLMEERRGRLSHARELYEAVRERVGGHAQASAHLAAVLAATGEKPRAIAILRELCAASDDPEYPGQLAALTGGEEARVLRAQAAKGYDVLVARHPEAFADHAARFWLSAGDAKRALALAEKNLANRPTREAHQLVIEAAGAAKQGELACRTADAALALPHPTPHLRLACARAFTACGQQAKADAQLAAATR